MSFRHLPRSISAIAALVAAVTLAGVGPVAAGSPTTDQSAFVVAVGNPKDIVPLTAVQQALEAQKETLARQEESGTGRQGPWCALMTARLATAAVPGRTGTSSTTCGSSSSITTTS